MEAETRTFYPSPDPNTKPDLNTNRDPDPNPTPAPHQVEAELTSKAAQLKEREAALEQAAP